MIHEETVEVFRQGYKNCRILSSSIRGNGSDLFWYPNIPGEVKRAVRNNFNLNVDEEILFVRDTSFWNNRNQGTVITDCRFAFIPDNDNPQNILYLTWEEIKCVKYDANCLNFYGNGGKNDVGAVPIEEFTKNLGGTYLESCGCKLAKIFTSTAETQQEISISDIEDTFHSLIDEGKEDKALEYALEYRGKDIGNIELSVEIAEIYSKKGQAGVGLRILNEDIAYIENKMEDLDPEYVQSSLVHLRANRADIFYDLGNKIEARADAFFVKNNIQNGQFSPEYYSEFEECLEEIENDFTEHFFEIPYQKRKTFVPVKSYDGIDLMKNTLQVVNINHLPDIKFPVGHPITNQLYIGHPYIPKKYIPFESYEQEFIEDKVREYCQIMQFLGATEINIESINSSDSKSADNFNSKMGGKANVRSASASAESTVNRANQLLESISQSIQLHQKYHPKGAPKLPTDMVWYDNEPSWQRTYKQRMQGSLLEHEERIETKKSRVVNSSELKTLAAEFKVLIVNAGGQWEQSIEEQFESQENVVLSIKVKFAPLESLMEKNKSTSSPVGEIQKKESPSIQEYTEAEEEYIEEVRACLEESSEISPREHRLLNRLRDRLGISEERAAELEALLQQPQLSKEEEEYMEEVRACLEESYEVSHSERRLLNKLREQLGISEERAIEIENLFQNAN